ncbi:MAG: class I SAM-dependent methyltransferase [Dehalococcoidia bacterium]|nr:class I SAM-dependent methyltransferase [Dehalococcoidia bacterium]
MDVRGDACSIAAQPSEARRRYWQRLREPPSLVEGDVRAIARVRRRAPVFDVGCGNGGFVRACRARGIDAVGVERFGAAAAVAAARGIDVLQAAGEELPLARGALDCVRLKEVLEHVQRPLDLVTEVRRVLRPGGVLLAYVPTQWSQLYPFPANFYDDYTHVRAFSRIGLERLLEDAGFARIVVAGSTPPLRWWQRPVGALLSRTLPFLWRAVAVNGGDGA